MTFLVVLGVAGVVAGGFWPRWRQRLGTARRRAGLEAVLPEVIDLVAVVLGAGGTISHAVEVLADDGPVAVRSDFRAVLDELDAGEPLARRLSVAADRLGSGYRPLLAALIATERDGAPVAGLVLRLGDEARAARRRRGDRRARTLAVQVLFPLVCCSLPAVLVGAVIPLALVTLGSIPF